MSLIIDRSEWVRGGASYLSVDGESELYNGHHMCCLGFLGRHCGLLRCDMYANTYPSSIRGVLSKKWPSVLFEKNDAYYPSKPNPISKWEVTLARINDAQVDDAIREEWLITGFKILMNIDLSFVGGSPRPEKQLPIHQLLEKQ